MKYPYKDRNGTILRVGDVVARAITINHENFMGFSFTVNIVKKSEGRLILDGAYCWGYLSEADQNTLYKVSADTDLGDVQFQLGKVSDASKIE